MASRKCQKCASGAPHEFRHGTLHAFQYHDCRCAQCKRGARAQCNDWRTRNPEKQLGTHGSPEQRRTYYRANARQYRQYDAEQAAEFARAAGQSKRRTWTPEEDAVVSRTDLTLLEMAYLLGRRRGSILYRRNTLREMEITA